MSIDRVDQESIEQLENRLQSDLLGLARGVIENRPENANFMENPDDPAEHDPNWHQFGILTHTNKFLEMYKGEEQGYLHDWGMDETVSGAMSEPVDGRSKAELIRLSVLLHDIGKFARNFKEKDGETKPDYDGHEAKSEAIINGSLRGKLSLEYGLTPDQISYIAGAAGLHYELGKVRSMAKEMEGGYSMKFAESREYGEMIGRMFDEFSDYKAEIGLLFLGDGLSKTDVIVSTENDEELEAKTPEIAEEIERRGLNPKLINAIKQRAVNIAVAKRYFQELVVQSK